MAATTTATSPVVDIAKQTSAAMGNIVKDANATVKKHINTINTKINVALARDKASAAKPGKPWKTSFWACCVPWDLCILAAFCPCFVFGKTWHRVENGGDMTTYGPLNLECCLYCLSSQVIGLSPLYQAIALNNMRGKLDLQGSIVEDVLKACCCHCCSIMQAEKESKIVLGGKRSGMDGMAEDPYAAGAKEKMVMAPQGETQSGPTRLNRISEETTRSRAGSNVAGQHDSASEITAVNAPAATEPPTKIQTDGAMETRIVNAHNAKDLETRLQTDGTIEAEAVRVQTTKDAAPQLSIAESALLPLWAEMDPCERCPNCVGTQ